MLKKTISFRADENVETYINDKSKELNLSKTEFIVNSIMNNSAAYINERKEVVKGLANIGNIIADIERKAVFTYEDINKIKNGVDEIWHMLT